MILKEYKLSEQSQRSKIINQNEGSNLLNKSLYQNFNFLLLHFKFNPPRLIAGYILIFKLVISAIVSFRCGCRVDARCDLRKVIIL